MIDSHGVVTPIFSRRRSTVLENQRRIAHSQKVLGQDLFRPSKMRKVSLVRLEKACEEYAKNKTHVPLDIQFMAGLQRIDYVFVYPEKKDVVIAGPAEGFAENEIGRMVGITSGRPPIRLDDLVVALRSIRKGKGLIGCSIDQNETRRANMARFQRQNRGAASVRVVQWRYRRMAEILGMQKVTVWGVPEDSHFAQTLVEADYRMKRLAIGLEPAQVKGFRSHLDMNLRGNSQQRWWFAPFYDEFEMNDDETAFHFAGQRVQLLANDELVNAKGKRKDAATTRLTTAKYAKHFTAKFPALANQKPIFADLQTLFDVSVFAALLKKHSIPEKIGWGMKLFLDEGRANLIAGNVPRQVHSLVNYRMKGRRSVIGMISGGVMIDPELTVRQLKYKTSPRNQLGELQKESQRSLQDDKIDKNWWWD